MTRNLAIFLAALLCAGSAWGHHGLTDVPSAYPVTATADRLVSALKAKGVTVFARIDHAAGAKKTGQQLPPTQLVIFGNPKLGTPLMKCSRTAGIDLPMKALIWEDARGKVWLTYNSASYLSARHGLEECAATIKQLGNVLANFAWAATRGD